MLDRRAFLKSAAASALAPSLARCDRAAETIEPWSTRAFRKEELSPVAVLAAEEYDGSLVDVVLRGLDLCQIDPRDKRVVLKPNFVEFDPVGAINTHPALLASAAEAFRVREAKAVVVAEGPGHRRDTGYILTASGLDGALEDTGARYVDLNGDAIRPVAAASHWSSLGTLNLPRTVLEADLFVSMPKLKTHHWVGVTLSMKNLFGIMPGSVYGWPKNALHYAGIEQSILDINATVSVPRFNIVDGIVGMEGNGPIQGTPRHSGVVVFGADPVAVDATSARLMGFEPWHVGYLTQADRFLGNAAADRIEQRGEPLERFAQDYAVLPRMDYLKPSSAAAP